MIENVKTATPLPDGMREAINLIAAHLQDHGQWSITIDRSGTWVMSKFKEVKNDDGKADFGS